MTSRKEQQIPQSEVAKYYDGKSVLITGTAGFVGTILLEILLRCCPGVRRIYIILRAKKGMLAEDRKKVIFQKDIFKYVKDKCPDVLDKVTAISGDVTRENLGMNGDDLRKVVEEVSIVFHIAATISFLKPLRFVLTQNVIGTYNIIEFCRKLKHVDGLVYTSTAFSNCNRETIDEIVYEMPFKAVDALETLRKGSNEELDIFFDKCMPKFPNFYTFSKCVAENLLAETAADLPVSIVRPSIITCAWKGILPGYIEEGSGLYSLSVGIGKGFIRVMQVDKELIVDHIPVDIVGNTHIVAAWLQDKERLPSPSVYNCASSDIIHCKWQQFCDGVLELVRKYPVPNSYQTPDLKLYKSSVAYWFHSMLEHYSPAIVIDAILWLSGHKPRLFKLYRFYDITSACVLHFRMNEWKIPSANFQSLSLKQNETDKEVFFTDIRQYNVDDMIAVIPSGAPIYKEGKDNKSYEERIRTAYIRHLQTSFIKWFFIGISTFMGYKIIF